MRAGIALGSNLGNRLENLRSARQAITRFGGRGDIPLASAVYESEAAGCEPNAPRFYNAVIEIEYDGSAFDLLRELRAIEAQLGRPPNHARNVSRTIDLDLLYFGREPIDTPELRVPHPRMHERRFVLAPLADIRPDLVLPEQRATVAELLARLPPAEPVVRASEQW